MPEKEVMKRAERDREEGKSPSTQAGEFVREEFDHIREGKHGARSPQQAIAIGLSKARRAGIKLAPPKRGKTSARTRKQAERDLKKGKQPRRAPSRKRSRAVEHALQKESTRSASHAAISKQSRRVARRRGAASRHAAARRAVHTKGRQGLRRSARKAARTRRRHSSR